MKPLIIVSGPTASGKTGLAVEIAKSLKGEILNCDSVQIYREFNIGSAKPTESEKSNIQHHLLDCVDPSDDYNAADYAADASQVIEDLQKSNKIPVVVGGTSMYLTSLIHGLAELPTTDPEIRAELERKNNEDLYEELRALDSERAVELHVNDRMRVIRALEILKSAKSVSEEYKAHSFSEIKHPAIILVLCWQRETLYQRIDSRAQQMLEQGLEQEVETILAKYGQDGVRALSSLGYRQVIEFNQGKHESLAEAIAQQTRRYAKRQLTFWRNEPEKRGWIQTPSQDDPEANVLKSEFVPARPSQPVKDFKVLSLSKQELFKSLERAAESDSDRVEVWYLDAETLLTT